MKKQKKKNTSKAFTLMEVLIVVIILSVLAVIAIPNYQKTLIKSRYDTLKTYAKTIVLAADRYQMQSGHYTTKFSELDITYPIDSTTDHDGYSVTELKNGITCTINDNEGGDREMRNVICQRQVTPTVVMAYAHPFSSSPNVRECWVFSSDEEDSPNKICKEEASRISPNLQENGANIYFYN